ncbi:MAG: response regulator [Magnetococcales bacterium]|nr:response regulator [Magnetococcales bacterium]
MSRLIHYIEDMSFQGKLKVGFSILLVAFTIFAVAMFDIVKELESSNRWVHHTEKVIGKANKLMKLLVDMETGQRGFLIVGKESFLEPFNKGQADFENQIHELKRLVSDNPAQVAILERVDDLSHTWRSKAANVQISKRREIDINTDGMKDIIALVEAETGKQLMDQMRTIIKKFIEVEQLLIAERLELSRQTEATAETVALGGALLTLATGLLILLLVDRATAPLHKLTATMMDIAKAGDYTRRVEVSGLTEVVRIADVFNIMSQNTEEQVWLKKFASELSGLLQEVENPTQLTQQLISRLGDLLQVGFAGFYLQNRENGRYELTGRYRYNEPKHSKTSYASGEGLVGQCALENRTMIIKDIPKDYFNIHSGLGEALPNTIMAVPVTYQGQVFGVLEFATFGDFTSIQQALVDEQVPNVGLGLQSLQRRQQTQELLEKTQIQAEELQVREEELRDNNALLERQAQELEHSQTAVEERNEKLQIQQEELRVANEELEEKAQDLFASRGMLETKNQALGDAKKELERRAEELAISSKYKSEFLANMSHELRTPLNSLLILSKMLADNKTGNLTEKQVDFAVTINDSGSDLLLLINEILDLSKIESGKMELFVEPINVADFVAGLKRKFAPVAANKEIEFAIKFDQAPAKLRSDSQKLEQVIKNLLSNALKFTKQGKVSLQIASVADDIQLKTPGLTIKKPLAFTVTDTGIGIPAEKRKTIFEAFQQVDGSTSRNYGGTGLGLSISRELTKLLGGEIQIESDLGVGSTFSLIIPTELKEILPIPKENVVESFTSDVTANSDSDDDGNSLATSALSTPDKSSTVALPYKAPSTVSKQQAPDDRHELKPGDRSILIIEDDVRFSRIVADVARERGFSILLAEDGTTGLHFADFYQPSGIVLDIGLPGMDGWRVMEHLKNSAKTRHIPVHFMSSNDSSLDAMKRGAIGFLTKPVSMGEMELAFSRIEDMIDRPVKRLLLVEDDPVQLKSLCELIGNGDVQTVVAESGKKAEQLLAKELFDCIVLDIGLPDMDGLDLLEKLRTRDGKRGIPVVVYTGKELEPQERATLDHYAQSIIIKDVRSPERLLDDTALFLHRVESELPEEQRRIIRMLHDADSLFAGRKILVVDDDMRNTFSLSAILQEKEMEVLTAGNGEEALEQLESDPDVAIVLMDIMMPGMDGYEATRKIREQQCFADLPVIALTAKAMKGDRALCIEAGANDYLAKPVDTDKLLSMMRVWLYR